MLLFGRNETIVRELYRAFAERRKDDTRALMADDFTFTSPYDDGIGRDAFFERCWPNGDSFQFFEIEEIVEASDCAFVTYLVTTEDGTSFRNTEHLAFAGGKIESVDVYFGPSYRAGKFVAKRVG